MWETKTRIDAPIRIPMLGSWLAQPIPCNQPLKYPHCAIIILAELCSSTSAEHMHMYVFYMLSLGLGKAHIEQKSS